MTDELVYILMADTGLDRFVLAELALDSTILAELALDSTILDELALDSKCMFGLAEVAREPIAVDELGGLVLLADVALIVGFASVF